MLTLLRNIFNAIIGRIFRFLRLDKEIYDLVEHTKKRLFTIPFVQKAHVKHLKLSLAFSKWYNSFFFKIKLQNKIDCIKFKPKKIKLIEGLKKTSLPLLCFINNDLINIPAFLKYYRNLGIKQFVFVDFSKKTDCIDYLKNQSDVSLFKAPTENWNDNVVKTDIINYFLLVHFKAKARPLILQSTEYIIFPYIKDRKIEDLEYILNDFEQNAAFCTRVDLYSKNEIKLETINENTNPFDLFKHMDRYNFSQKNLSNEFCRIIGGPMLRTKYNTIPDEAPCLSSVQLPLNDKITTYKNYHHETNNQAYNCTIKNDKRFVSIVVLNFVQFNVGNLKDKYFNEHWSILYESPLQLEEMNLYQRGEWF